MHIPSYTSGMAIWPPITITVLDLLTIHCISNPSKWCTHSWNPGNVYKGHTHTHTYTAPKPFSKAKASHPPATCVAKTLYLERKLSVRWTWVFKETPEFYIIHPSNCPSIRQSFCFNLSYPKKVPRRWTFPAFHIFRYWLPLQTKSCKTLRRHRHYHHYHHHHHHHHHHSFIVLATSLSPTHLSPPSRFLHPIFVQIIPKWPSWIQRWITSVVSAALEVDSGTQQEGNKAWIFSMDGLG